MDNFAIRIRRADLDHADRRWCCITFGIRSRDEQALSNQELAILGEVVPDFQIFDGYFVCNCY